MQCCFAFSGVGFLEARACCVLRTPSSRRGRVVPAWAAVGSQGPWFVQTPQPAPQTPWHWDVGTPVLVSLLGAHGARGLHPLASSPAAGLGQGKDDKVLAYEAVCCDMITGYDNRDNRTLERQRASTLTVPHRGHLPAQMLTLLLINSAFQLTAQAGKWNNSAEFTVQQRDKPVQFEDQKEVCFTLCYLHV